MQRPILYIFTISHFCEKARWALDYLGVDHQVKVLAPGTHASLARKLGLKRGALPYMQTADGVIQGSDAIIDWAESIKHSDRTLGSEFDDVRSLEKRLDDRLGVHVRRWYYSEAIVEHPALVKPTFMHKLSLFEKGKLALSWSVVQKLMIKGMDLGPEQGEESLEIVKQELDWLDQRLALHAPFLSDRGLTRADITAASLLAPAVKPLEHPCASVINLPPRLTLQVNEFAHRPVWRWVGELYKTYRRAELN